MIPYKTFTEPILDLGFFQIQPWGLMVSLGFLIGLWIVSREAKKRGFNVNNIYSLALSFFIGGVLGARIGWILTEAPENIDFFNSLAIWNGGMISFGGLIGALILFTVVAYYKKIDLMKHLDIFAIGIPLGMAIGRIGCYLIGDHLGKATLLPWAILHYGQLTHPITLYEIIALFIIFGIIYRIKDNKYFDGALFLAFMAMYSFFRFFKDFLSTDMTYYGLTIAQYISLTVLIVSGFVMYKRRKK